jgi:hypothetical protein
MDSVPSNLVDKFAQSFAGEFAGTKVGFSLQQVTDYFTKYSNLVKSSNHYRGVNPTRQQLFIDSVYALNPKQQYYALNDLTWNTQPSKYQYPNETEREILRQELHSFISPDPIGLSFSKLQEPAFREDWAACLTRLQSDPASTFTAARTLLETLLKTIIKERGEEPDSSGDLMRLLKQAERCVGFNVSTSSPQSIHQIVHGLSSVVNGLAALSNNGGDRHGLVNGQSIDDPGLASLCVNAAGTVGLALIDFHLLTRIND